MLELATLVVAPRDGYPDATGRVPGRARSRASRAAVVVPGRPAAAPVGVGDPGARRGRPLGPLPRPGCGRGVYRRPWAVHQTTGGPIDRDRTRASRHRRRGTARPAPTACRDAPTTPRRTTGDRRRRSSSPAASSSWPRTRRRPTSCCSSSRPLTTLADYFVICSGGSERQLDAIADGIVSALRDEKTEADRARGDGRVALGAARLRVGHRPHLHAARARLLRAREALVRGEDDPARAVSGAAPPTRAASARTQYGWPGTDGS